MSHAICTPNPVICFKKWLSSQDQWHRIVIIGSEHWPKDVPTGRYFWWKRNGHESTIRMKIGARSVVLARTVVKFLHEEPQTFRNDREVPGERSNYDY